jgi:anti-anti-sigma regulatory factor
MRRRLLILTKDPEFDARGEVVLGQCEPFTSGWRLFIVHTDGRREPLMTGTYTDLRKVQEICTPIDDPAKIKKRVEELKVLLTTNMTETIRVPIPSPDASDVTKEMRAISIDPPRQTPGGLLSVESDNGVLVATLVQAEKAGDAAYVKNEISSLLESHPRAVVIDLIRLKNVPQSLVKELAAAREMLRANGTTFALCNVPTDTQQTLKNLRPGSKDVVPIFETCASAVAALS